MASDIETRLRKYRHEFEKCLKDPSIVSHLLANSVITDVDAARIKNLYIDRETVKASKELLDAVFTSKAPGKWRSFVDSLESADYPYLKELLSYQNRYDAFSSSRAQKILCLFTPYLEQMIHAHEFVSELKSRGVINAADEELILKTFETKGDIYSTMVLLDRMQCRKSPQDWYYEFLDLLMMKKCEHIVKEMEPDFIENPSSFMPKLDRGEGFKDSNDLGAPQSLTMRQDSHLTSTEYQNDSLQTNLKEFNIKPTVTKSLPVDIYRRANRKPGKTDEQDNPEKVDDDDDDEDEDSMGSDYDNTSVEAEALGSNTAAPFKLRKYQLELAENAVLGRNTIICAETGSGKTWVALYIVQQHLQNARNGQKKVVFMARTGALIKQQSDRFKTYLPQFRTRLITGEDDQSRMLNMFLDNYDILCFTPQILVNNLEDNVIKSLSEFSLLILDECHHTRGDGPYSTLMRKYLVEKSKTKKEMPQVVGLTASIGVGKSRTDQESVDYILRVCSILDVRIISTVERNFKELKKHVSIPDEETIQLVKQKDDPCKHFILTAMEETEDMLQDNSLMQPDMIDLMDKQPRDRESQEYNKWTVDVIRAALLKVDDYYVSRDIRSCAKYLNIYNSALEVNKLLLSRDVIKYLAEKHRLEGQNKDKLTEIEKELFKNLQNVQKTINVKGKNTENPNVRILSDTLRKMLDDKGDDSRAMVFVKARATCRSLAAFLDRDLQSSGVKASPLYGKENRGGDDGMTERQQTEILDKFRSGFFKVLVCTSVANEGIDVPYCNIVLSYEYSGDEITKIQMKGRARKKKATTIIMGSDKVVEQEMINTYKAAMMYRAMNTVKQLDPKFINMKVNAFQSEETHKYRFKAEVEKLKKGRKPDEDYAILCGRCNTFACYVSDVRQLGPDRIVIVKDFADKITRKEHKKPKTYDGLHKKYKMYCKKCPIDWGIIGLRDGLDCMILKIYNFKFRNLRTHVLSTYKKWIDVPYAVPEIKLEDLPILLASVESLPVEVLKMDDESIELYKEALETGTTRAHTIRVMVVGHMGVGKTTLTKRLFGENVDVSSDNESTNSIDVHVRKCKVTLKDGNWLSMTDGDSERNHNSHIVSELMKWSKEKHMKSNEDILQSHQNEAETTQNLQEELLYTRTRVDDRKREVNETVTEYENNGTRSEEKNFSPEFDPKEARRKLELMKLIQDTVIGSINETNVTEDAADLSVWDFAGQHIYYGTHQIFLSRRAVYLLVIDLSKHVDSFVEDDCFIDTGGEKQYKISEFVKFWLNSIHTYCPSKISKEPPVILVGTFADKLAEERQNQSEKIFSDVRKMLTEFEELYEHLATKDISIDNAIKDPNVEVLKRRIVELSKAQSNWDDQYPVRWILLEKAIMSFRESGLPILERKTLMEVNEGHPLSLLSSKMLDLFLRYHHETGLILYFSDENLKDYILLKPQWLVDAMKCLISAKTFCQKDVQLYKMWLSFDDTAILKKELIDAVWNSDTQFAKHKTEILHFMQKLDLIAKPQQHCNGNSETGEFYVAPCMLKAKVPDAVLEFPVTNRQCKSTSRLCFSTSSKIMPVQLYHSLIAECIMKWPINKKMGKLQIFCGCCVFDADKEHVLTVCFANDTVQIWVTKFSLACSEPDVDLCTEIKSFIQIHLENILKGFGKIDIFVKCPNSLPKQSGHLWRIDELQEEIRCDDHDLPLVFSKASLMKYWDPMCLDQEAIFPRKFLANVPTEKQRNQMAQLIGKEYHSLAIQLGLTQVNLDHIDMNERLLTPIDKIMAMLNMWVKQDPRNATFEALKKSMSSTGIDWMNIFSAISQGPP